MSRSGYTDDDGEGYAALWRGAVKSAIRGHRGQALLRELRDAMDAMPEKILIAGELQADGAYCTLGVVGAKRGINMADIDPEDYERVAKEFGIAEALAREIEYINDELGDDYKVVDGKWTRCAETPEERWLRVRKWVGEQIK